MKTVSLLLLSALLAVSARAEDKHAAPAAPATPAAPAADAKAAPARKPDEVVARVGKAEIKWGDVDMAARSFVMDMAARGRDIPPEHLARLQYDVLGQMVVRELILQEGIGHEPADLETKVKEQVVQTEQQAGGPEALAKALEEMSMTREEYTKRIREGLLIQETVKKVVDSKAKVTAEDTQKFYDENRSKFVVPEQVRASHILILIPQGATEDVKSAKLTQIKAALSLVKGGTPFADVAKKFSEDPGSKEQGGDLDFFPRGHMVPEFETAAFSLKKDEVSDVITTQYGYHVIKVTDRKAAGELPYAEVKPRIESYLKEQQSRVITEQYMKDLRAKSKVEVLIPEPPMPAMTPRTMTIPPPAK